MKISKWLLMAAGAALLLPSSLLAVEDLLADSDSNKATPGGLSKIAVGEYTAFLIINGQIRALGSNRANEAGFPEYHGGIGGPAEAIPVPHGVKFTDVTCGGYQSAAVDDTGHVWTWGGNNFGEFGNGTVGHGLHAPTKLETDVNDQPFDNIVNVIGGFEFFLALKKDGTVWVWGSSGRDKDAGFDSTGMCGNGDKTQHNVSKPSQVIFPDGVTIKKITASWVMGMALDSDGGVWTWGGGGPDNRGTGGADSSKPAKVPKLPTGIKWIATGIGWSVALDADGNLWGWGSFGDYLGQGDDKSFAQIIPTPRKLHFPDLDGHIVSVECSMQSTHALKDDGTLWGWGASPMSEVGDGTAHDWAKQNPPSYSWDWNNHEDMVMKPVQVLDDVETVVGSAQAAYVYAIKKDGTIWSWGRNKTGVLGNGTLPGSQESADHPNKWDVSKPAQVKPF